MKLFVSILAIPLFFPVTVYGYSQDPRSCADPRTQYPSNPPCQSQRVAQLDRTHSNRTSYIGTVPATNDWQARSLCSEKGGNIVVKEPTILGKNQQF